ncbi:MAG: sulfotransferase [Thermodesulfobacteriota bacterium]
MREDPVIIVGMHRSGTTILAKLLSECGLFIGKKLDTHNEAIFFKSLNDRVLHIAHTYWDNPLNIEHLFSNKRTSGAVEIEMRKVVSGKDFLFDYVGWENTLKFFRNPFFSWGWKEPRTTVTLPLWLSIFPKAKIIYVYRNGIDVANSLTEREKKRIGSINSPFFSLRCLNLMESFHLWEEYNRMLIEHLSLFPDVPVHKIRYEDLIDNPKERLRDMLEFIGLPCKSRQLSKCTTAINKNRMYSFINDHSLLDFYKANKDTDLMVKLKYDNII